MLHQPRTTRVTIELPRRSPLKTSRVPIEAPRKAEHYKSGHANVHRKTPDHKSDNRVTKRVKALNPKIQAREAKIAPS